MRKYIYGTLIGLGVLILFGGGVAWASVGHGFWSNGPFSEGLAKLLGISTDELKVQVQDKTLPQVLDDKGISHQQLYDLKEDARLQPQADILGMSLDDYKKELDNGKAFSQLLDEKGIGHVQLQEKMKSQMKERITQRLQARVDDGEITQEQMQERLQNFDQDEGGYMMRGAGGFRGLRHMMDF